MPSFDAKKIFWVLLNVALAVLVVGLIYGIKAASFYSRSLNPARVISVSAEGKSVVIPDVAKINFGVISEGANPVDLQTDNAKKVNGALEFIKSQGVEAEDIKTAQYNLAPRYEYDEKLRRSFIVGYELRQNISSKLRDFSKISAILGGLPELGINEIGQLQFDVDDPDKYLNEARKEAFEKARVKAESMAKQNGVRLKRVVNFYESQGYSPMPLYAKSEIGGELSSPLAPTIEPGTQEVTLQVSVTYEIR